MLVTILRVVPLLVVSCAATGEVVAAERDGSQTANNADATAGEPHSHRYRVNRCMLVGPWHNRPEEYEGYNGFVG